MAACIPYVQWIEYNAQCRDKQSGLSVKGFGYTATGLRALRGLGLSISASITPASVANAINTGNLVQTAPAPAPAASPVVSNAPSINTTPICNDPNDPCCIVQNSPPCPLGTACPATCPTGFHSVDLLHAPGTPAKCNCVRDHVPTLTPNTTMSLGPTPGSPASSSTAGFSKLGLLAAGLAAVGVVYLVTKKRAAA